MYSAALGNKHACLGCEARFYDLNKDPAVCPKCNQTFVPVQPSTARFTKRQLTTRKLKASYELKNAEKLVS